MQLTPFTLILVAKTTMTPWKIDNTHILSRLIKHLILKLQIEMDVEGMHFISSFLRWRKNSHEPINKVLALEILCFSITKHGTILYPQVEHTKYYVKED